jgi:hypothetical protein
MDVDQKFRLGLIALSGLCFFAAAGGHITPLAQAIGSWGP